MRHQVSKDLYAYWDNLRGERSAPDRADIDLRAIRDILADTFIIEEGADGAYPVRVSGARVENLWGQGRQGACFTQLWRPADRLGVEAGLANVVENASHVVASVRLHAPGDARLDLELLLLPLRHFNRSHTRILGALTPLSPVDWLGQTPISPLEMISMRCVEGIASRRVQPPRQRPTLVVYEGGKR